MKHFKGQVAVVTGAASGIGKGLAERCIEEGMKVVLADVQEDRLVKVEQSLRETGGEVMAVVTDVSNKDAINNLATVTMERFGAAHLLFNNAGVGAGGRAWECTQQDWEWTLGVNLWGVIHAINTFVPIMLKQDTNCHIINTASIEGLWARPGHVPYQVSKHGVVTLSEVLYQDLKFAGARIGVTVVCPGAVDTNIIDSWRNRPDALKNTIPGSQPPSREAMARVEALRKSFREGMTPAECAELIFTAIRDEALYLVTHPHLLDIVRERMDNIINQRNPDLSQMPMRPEPPPEQTTDRE
jgi:NADP-dependent 3-hydroxy acid dehydrogenase YdfG